MGRLVRTPQVPDFDSQVAGLNGVQSGLAGRQMVKADPADGRAGDSDAGVVS